MSRGHPRLATPPGNDAPTSGDDAPASGDDAPALGDDAPASGDNTLTSGEAALTWGTMLQPRAVCWVLLGPSEASVHPAGNEGDEVRASDQEGLVYFCSRFGHYTPSNPIFSFSSCYRSDQQGKEMLLEL